MFPHCLGTLVLQIFGPVIESNHSVLAGRQLGQIEVSIGRYPRLAELPGAVGNREKNDDALPVPREAVNYRGPLLLPPILNVPIDLRSVIANRNFNWRSCRAKPHHQWLA